jgi:uncharacterized membrane protein YkoI
MVSNSVVGTLLGIALSGQAQALTGQKYSREARIGLAHARSIAMKQEPGSRIISEELEKE